MSEQSEIIVILKDGKERSYPTGVSGIEIATSISPQLKKEAIALRVIHENAMQDYDLSVSWHQDIRCHILTVKDADILELLRHDAAHVMAQAVKELYPNTQVAIGPAIENGFYYDFYPETPFTPEDLSVIEERMRLIIDRDDPITREVWTRDHAIEFFQGQGESFKVELIRSFPVEESLSVYHQGGFTDLCRGPHLPSTGRLGKAFKLMKIAGAYWQGDSKKLMLQRIYGTAWANKKDLDAHLHRLQEAEKRDHRKLGKAMDLFHFQEEAPGSVFWHPKGWTLYLTLQNYIRNKMNRAGYQEIHTPQLVHRKLWEASGHWDKFRDSMLTAQMEENVFALKPMNCPCHVQVFSQGIKSYRDLPLRLAEFGSCIRYESSGSLMGLMRLRAFVQDDAHIFCTPEQITSETQAFCHLLLEVYRELGFEEVEICFSDRPQVRAGEDTLWDQAEYALQKGAQAAGLTYTLNPGEGAFYGPKLEFVLKDALGRRWQCGTLQLDFVLPQRLGAYYTASDGSRQTPVMLHRAILGSLERFVGILIEHYAGNFPLWLAPVQTVVATITSDAESYAKEVAQACATAGLRAEIDVRNEKIPYKVRELSLAKIPYIMVVGKTEVENRTVSIRKFGDTSQEVLELPAAIDKLQRKSKVVTC